ncbi:hypothetical protein STEG23_015132, partial [Scotinomys teguina]
MIRFCKTPEGIQTGVHSQSLEALRVFLEGLRGQNEERILLGTAACDDDVCELHIRVSDVSLKHLPLGRGHRGPLRPVDFGRWDEAGQSSPENSGDLVSFFQNPLQSLISVLLGLLELFTKCGPPALTVPPAVSQTTHVSDTRAQLRFGKRSWLTALPNPK